MEERNSFVYIIESPSLRDIIRDVQEGALLRSALKLIGIQAVYRLIRTSGEIDQAMAEFAQYDISGRRHPNDGPFLHISAHGDGNSIGFTDNTELNWAGFAERLNRFPPDFRRKVILCLSSCYGTTAADTGGVFEGTPVYGVIGCDDRVDWDESAVGFVTFYHLVTKGAHIPDAVEVMNLSAGVEGFRAIHYSEAEYRREAADRRASLRNIARALVAATQEPYK